MANNRGTFTVRVVSDTKPAEQGLDRFATKTQQLGGKVEAAGKKMTIFATLPIAAAMGAATKAASDLQQAVGGTEAVFGDAGDAIDKYSKKAAKASGLSEREFREATTSIGGQLKRMTGDVDLAAEQSMKLTEVAADLAATYGGTTAEAVAALGSAFRGEADPAERFNLNLKIGAVNAKAVEMGLAETTSEVDDNARAQATLALIMEQSADAQGQFAREADSAAGSMQIAKAEMENASAEIGEALLPLAAKAAGGIADLASAFGELPTPVQNGVVAIGGLLAVSGPLMTVGGKFMQVWKGVGPLLDTVATGAYDAAGAAGKLTKSFGGAGGLTASMGAVGALVATGVVLYGDYADTKAEAARVTDRLVEAMKAENAELETNAALADELSLKDYADDIRSLEGGFATLTSGVREHADELERLDDDLPAIANGMLSLEDALGRAGLKGTDFGDALLTLQGTMSAGDFADLLNDLDGLADRYGEATTKTRNQEAAARDVAGATEEAGAAAEGAAPKLQGYASEIADAEEKNRNLEDSIKDVNDALRAQFDPLFAARDALFKNQNAQKAVAAANLTLLSRQHEYNHAVKEFGEKSPEANDALLRLLEATNDVDEANRNAADSALDVTTATNELAAKMRDGVVDIDASRRQIKEWEDQGLLTEQQAEQMRTELDLVAVTAENLNGKQVALEIALRGYQETILQLMALDDLANHMGIRGSFGYQGAVALGAPRASGGNVRAGGLYRVNEDGTEVFVPDRSGTIIPADALSASPTGAQVTNHITINNPKAEPASESMVRAGRKLALTF